MNNNDFNENEFKVKYKEVKYDSNDFGVPSKDKKTLGIILIIALAGVLLGGGYYAANKYGTNVKQLLTIKTANMATDKPTTSGKTVAVVQPTDKAQTVDKFKNSLNSYFKQNNINYQINGDFNPAPMNGYTSNYYALTDNCRINIISDAHKNVVVAYVMFSQNVSDKEWQNIVKAFLTSINHLSPKEINTIATLEQNVPKNESHNNQDKINGIYFSAVNVGYGPAFFVSTVDFQKVAEILSTN